MVGAASACLKVCIAALNRLHRHIEQFALTRRTIYLLNLQIVTFCLVKKSEATSQECQRNRSTCSQLVKMQGFYDYVYCWLLNNCEFDINFLPLFISLKCPKTVFFGLQKHRFYPPKDDVLHAKSIAFAIQNLCFRIFRAIFWPNKRKYFSRLEKWFVMKKENQECSRTLKK